MATNTTIEWTEVTWNPVTGCSKISAGCKNCYAERMAGRLKAMGQPRYANGFELTLQPDLVNQPDRWRGARTVFVNSMSDLFHKNVPTSFIEQVFETIERNPQHVFQVLTKRSGRLLRLANSLSWPANLWMGVSVENEQAIHRIDDLVGVPAAVRFLSCEPLLGPLKKLPLAGIHWVIAGGEAGPRARPMSELWVQNILSQCDRANVPFFFKQWGGTRKKSTGRMLNGRTYDAMPMVGGPQGGSHKLSNKRLQRSPLRGAAEPLSR